MEKITYAKHLESLDLQRKRYALKQEKAILSDRKRWEYRSVASVNFPMASKLRCVDIFVEACQMGRLFPLIDKQIGRMYGIDVIFKKGRKPLKLRIDKRYLKERDKDGK